MDTEGSEPGARTPHIPVLCAEVVAALACPGEGLLLDGTVGAGGHAFALLGANPQLRLLGIDRDPLALALASEGLAPFGGRVTLQRARYSEAARLMGERGEGAADRVLLDLGVSSMQLDAPDRGFSYREDGPLDMRMESEGETALELMRRMDEEELANLIFTYADERKSRRIAREIKDRLGRGLLRSNMELREICRRAYPPGRHHIDPAARTFMALRMAVNDELGELESFLEALPSIVREGSRIAVISFHSAEDRIVKRTYRRWHEEGWVRTLTKKPQVADESERRDNPRARSAKLRVCEVLRQQVRT